MNMPPPCQHCGLARLSSGLCPHCEHVYCVACRELMPLEVYADHCWAMHRAGPAVRARSAYLFWWEIRRDMPERCPECEAILTPEGLCPKAVEAFNSGQGVRVNDLRLLGIGPGWPMTSF